MKRTIHRAFADECLLNSSTKDKRQEAKFKIMEILRETKDGMLASNLSKKLKISDFTAEQYLRELLADGNWGIKRRKDKNVRKFTYFFQPGFPTSLLTEEQKEAIRKKNNEKRIRAIEKHT